MLDLPIGQETKRRTLNKVRYKASFSILQVKGDQSGAWAEQVFFAIDEARMEQAL